MTQSLEQKNGDDGLTKNGVEFMDQLAPVPTENTLSAWECIRKNPKVCFWTLWANSKHSYHSPGLLMYLRKISRLHHDRLRKPCSIRLPRNAGVPVRRP